MEENLTKALKQVIKSEIGNMVHDEIKLQFEPIRKVVDDARDENRKSYDQISKQITEDRVKIDKIEVSQAKSEKQGSQMIDNQNNQKEDLVNAVKEEAQQIPKHTEKAVNKIFENKPLLIRLKEKFKK